MKAISLVRLGSFYACALLYTWGNNSVARWLIIPVVTMTILELTTQSGNKPSTVVGEIYAIVAGLLPINYVLNLSANRNKLPRQIFAVIVTLVRLILGSILILGRLIWTDYANAWSCYEDKKMKEYTEGICPLYDGDFLHSKACTNSDPNNFPCLGVQDPDWGNSHVVMHMCTIISAFMYGQHFATTVLQFTNMEGKERHTKMQ